MRYLQFRACVDELRRIVRVDLLDLPSASKMLYAVDHRDGIFATNWIAHDDARVYVSNDHDVLVIVLGISCGFNQIDSDQVTEVLLHVEMHQTWI